MANRTSSTLRALSEDLHTAWVPDVLDHVDAEPLVETDPSGGTLGLVDRFAFPKPDGSEMVVAALGTPAMGQLHRAVEPLREVVDAYLDPGVCGYRRGAEEGFSYSAENVRFQKITEAEAEHAEYVVFADVHRFFEHCPWDAVINQIDAVHGRDVDLDPLRRFAKAANASGQTVLPAGYANARLLGNAILAPVDAALGETFVRWVDDYRIFVHSQAEAEACLARLRSRLSRFDLTLNEAKTKVVPAQEVSKLNGLPLESVYHPDVESPQQVRAALRSLFAYAVEQPDTERRNLRFVLPRLAAQRDDIAVDWVLANLHSRPWEAPRFAVYLAAFASSAQVRAATQTALLHASSLSSPWLAIRLAALACSTGIDASCTDSITRLAHATESLSLWGLLLRALALSGHSGAVQELVAAGVRDPRAALAALRDIAAGTSTLEGLVAEATRASLGNNPAPTPSVSSIL